MAAGCPARGGPPSWGPTTVALAVMKAVAAAAELVTAPPVAAAGGTATQRGRGLGGGRGGVAAGRPRPSAGATSCGKRGGKWGERGGEGGGREHLVSRFEGVHPRRWVPAPSMREAFKICNSQSLFLREIQHPRHKKHNVGSVRRGSWSAGRWGGHRRPVPLPR